MAIDRKQADRALPAGYYAENFRTLLDTVERRYGDLLSADERAFAERYRALPMDAQRLYVRLISRKGPLLRRDRLVYPEIPDIAAALAVLDSARFADRAKDAPTSQLLALAMRAELGTLWGDLISEPLPAKRADRLAGLLEHGPDVALRASVCRLIEVVRPRGSGLITLYRLLFFGSLHQDLTAFVLRDLGVIRYEAYRLDRSARRLGDRRAIDDALALQRARSAVHQAIAAGDLASAVSQATALSAPSRPWHPAVAQRADRIVNRVARELERADRPREALTLYRASLAPPARERRARLLARLGRERDALALLETIASSPQSEQERIFAPWFGDRLKRRLARRFGARPPRPRPRKKLPRRSVTIDRRPDTPVEQLALEALGGRGFFAENWLWKSLFGLAFWDIVFAPVKGAFEHPFQLGPLDLDGPGFRQARGTMIRQRLAWLRATPYLAPPLLRVYDAKRGIANALVSWHAGGREAISLALGRMRGGLLAPVLDRISRDPGRYRRGLPDLFMLIDRWPGFALYEVKAPGDQLRPEQRSWLGFFADTPIPAAIIELVWR